jgi:hypothetical protein
MDFSLCPIKCSTNFVLNSVLWSLLKVARQALCLPKLIHSSTSLYKVLNGHITVVSYNTFSWSLLRET